MRALSSLALMVVLAGSLAQAAIPGNKRTIFTSGEKVYPIRYQLGQSTVIDLGVKPEVVICGNKNYFNIEKLKSGITIQPLNNFSTNLTVLSGQKRFLFYLTPAGPQSPDGFVDIKWVPLNVQRAMSTFAQKADTQIELNQKVQIGSYLEMNIVRMKSSSDSRRKIFDLLVKNKGREMIALREIELTIFDGSVPIKNQALVWEKNSINEKSTVVGRLIITKSKARSPVMSVKFQGKILKLKLKGIGN